MLRIEQLRVAPLPSLTFNVAPGECLAVEGRSGAGKTRLLRAIADLDPAPGYIHLDGIERHEMTGPRWRRQVRYVSTEPGWWADTAGDHLPAGLAADKLRRLLVSVDLGSELLKRPITDLSTGERRRLALVMALADEPRVLLLDEPMASLDTARAALVGEVIRFQTFSGRIVLLTSHDPTEVDRLAHHRLMLTPPADDATEPERRRERII